MTDEELAAIEARWRVMNAPKVSVMADVQRQVENYDQLLDKDLPALMNEVRRLREERDLWKKRAYEMAEGDAYQHAWKDGLP